MRTYSILLVGTIQVEAAENMGKALVLVNPLLKDIASAAGLMGVR